MKNLSFSIVTLTTTLLLCDGAFVSNAQTPVKTRYGVLTPSDDTNIQLTAANNLGTDYVRDRQILTQWNGTNNGNIDFWIAHKKKILLNINNDVTPSAFPKDLVAYKSKLQAVLDVYGSSVELVVIENEELHSYDSSSLYHLGSMQDYINELTTAVNVCTQKGVPVTNGGLTTPLVASLKHYYTVNNKPDSVTWLCEQMGGISTDSTLWLRTDSLLAAYKKLALSYVNLHWYEPTKSMTRMTGVLTTICNYITQQTGKKVITNETGIKTNDSSFVTGLMKQWDSVNVKYCIVFDGAGSNGARPLTSAASGALLPTGIAFRNYNFGTSTSCLQSINITPAGPVYICQGGTTTLTASAGFSNYLWSNGATTQSIVISSEGNYSVTSNPGNCIAFSMNTSVVTINALPPKPTINAGNNTSNLCPNKTVNLTALAQPTYLWNTGEITKTITVNKAGSYKVTVADINGCKNTSDFTTVTYQTCNAPVNLRVTGVNTARATLNWDTASCAVGYQYSYHIKGSVLWTIVPVAGGGASSRTIYYLLPGTIYQWKIRTNCATIPDTTSSSYTTGPEFTTLSSLIQAQTTNENAESTYAVDIRVYPNPVTTTATVTVNNPGNELKITLTDFTGKVYWQSEKITASNITIPVNNLASGLYILTVKNKPYTKILKLVKE